MRKRNLWEYRINKMKRKILINFNFDLIKKLQTLNCKPATNC
jgi:hypothetical protein